jgi:hypothetical protein
LVIVVGVAATVTDVIVNGALVTVIVAEPKMFV